MSMSTECHSLLMVPDTQKLIQNAGSYSSILQRSHLRTNTGVAQNTTDGSGFQDMGSRRIFTSSHGRSSIMMTPVCVLG